jgi:hypothetical protein
MTVQTALPARGWHEAGAILTFIVPAPNGCDLACPFCYIRQRGEDLAEAALTPADYARFIREVAAARPVAALCVQGYEPLLPAAFAHTRAILATGRLLRLPASLVTNGTHLAERVEALRVLAPARLAVSLDAATADAHDRQRGRAGAFAAIVRGLEAAAAGPDGATELGVTSVLLPKRRAQLDGLPALLAAIGVRRWAVTALQRVGRAGPVGARGSILAELDRLRAAAARAGIAFAVDDEFAGLAGAAPPAALRLNRLARPEGVFRLAPDGRCARGAELLGRLAADAPRWRPGVLDAGAFLAGLGAGVRGN